jgi:hypothetical protein
MQTTLVGPKTQVFRICLSIDKIRPCMAQVVSRRSLTAEAQVRARIFHVGFMVGIMAPGLAFLRILRFSPVSSISSRLPIFTHHLGDGQ